MDNEVMTFISGEIRYIEAQVFPAEKNETLAAESADFTLTAINTGETVKEGKCEMRSNDTARVLLDLTDVPKGSYELRVTMKALPEKIIGAQEIEVLR